MIYLHKHICSGNVGVYSQEGVMDWVGWVTEKVAWVKGWEAVAMGLGARVKGLGPGVQGWMAQVMGREGLQAHRHKRR